MIGKNRIVCVIPARGGSKGLPRKNLRNLIGAPLVAWPISAAKKCHLIDEVVLSTDDQEISSIGARYGAEVPFLRPKHLAEDDSTSEDVLVHALSYLGDLGSNFQYVVMLQPTSPFTTHVDLENAISHLHENRKIADSIVGYSKCINSHPNFCAQITETGTVEPLPGNQFNITGTMRRQEISDIYFEEGSLYVSDVQAFLTLRNFYSDRTLPYIVPKWKSLEIDDEIDLSIAEAIAKRFSLSLG